MLTFKKRIWSDRIDTLLRYYRNPRFALIDLAYGFFALFQNPYRICRKFLQKRNATEIYAYGETPFATYEKLVRECGVGSNDIWYEMGAGRGKGCFWLAHFAKCQVVGVEWIPQFVRQAEWILALFPSSQVRFECKEMKEADLSRATIIYLYGNHPPLKIPSNARVITISEPLPQLEVIKQFWVRYPWGRTSAYLQINRPSAAPSK